jgi:hypothetical protein
MQQQQQFASMNMVGAQQVWLNRTNSIRRSLRVQAMQMGGIQQQTGIEIESDSV